VFLDAARASSGLVGSAPPASNVDAGIGLRVRLIQGGGVARLDFARGLQDGRLALSVSWSSAAGSPFNRNGSW